MNFNKKHWKPVKYIYLAFIILIVSCKVPQVISDDASTKRKSPKIETNQTGKAILKGVVYDEQYDETVPFANVSLKRDGMLATGTTTNFDGEFLIDSIEGGVYDVELSFVGYPTEIIDSILLENNKTYTYTLYFEEEPSGGLLKPIIYLYPETTTQVHVQLDYNGDLIHTYPKYPTNGWQVEAYPDGTLIDANGQEYYALYWEGSQAKNYQPEEGFVIAGKDSRSFLESSLATLGLNRKEANEFIIYWLPQLEENAYNFIHFSSAEYEKMAALHISPTPETLIRVMMVFKPLEAPINIPLQNLDALAKQRKGFTVVEWGGSKLPNDYEF